MSLSLSELSISAPPLGRRAMRAMTVGRLCATLATVGIDVELTSRGDAPLYLLYEPRSEVVRYVGKAASRKRHDDEDRWIASSSAPTELRCGFATAIAERGLHRVRLALTGWRATAASEAIATWEDASTRVRPIRAAGWHVVSVTAVDAAFFEACAIAATVATGTALLNSHHTSMWWPRRWRASAVLGQIAACAAYDRGVL